MRTYSPSPTVRASCVPLYERGWLGLGATPVCMGLGQTGAKVFSAGGTVVTGLLPSLLAHTSIAAFAGPIAAAAAVVVGLIAGFWMAHDQRVAGAKDENAAVNSAVQAWDQSVKAIFDALNSPDPSQSITPAIAAQQLQGVMQTYWQRMLPHMSGPGRSDCSQQGTNCGCSDPYCRNKRCTAGCCVGCFDLQPSMQNLLAVLNSPNGGTAQVLQVYGSKYGAVSRGAYTLTYKPTAIGQLTALTGGIPPWMIAAGAGAALLAFAV